MPAERGGLEGLAGQEFPPHPTISEAAQFGDPPGLAQGEGGGSVGWGTDTSQNGLRFASPSRRSARERSEDSVVSEGRGRVRSKSRERIEEKIGVLDPPGGAEGIGEPRVGGRREEHRVEGSTEAWKAVVDTIGVMRTERAVMRDALKEMREEMKEMREDRRLRETEGRDRVRARGSSNP